MSNEAMKLALSVLEYWDVHGKLHQPTEEAITALKKALAEQSAQREPVARVIDDGTPEGATEWIAFNIRVEPLKTGDLLYTPPQPAQRKPLTDEQIDVLRQKTPPSSGVDFDVRCRDFARALEAAHGIKGDA